MSSLNPIPRICVHAPNHLGDSVMSIPMVQHIKKVYPQSPITVVTKQYLTPLWRLVTSVDAILTWDNESESIQSLVCRLKKKNFGISIILAPAKEIAGAYFLADIPVRAGYDFWDRKIFLTHSLKTNGHPNDPKLIRSHMSTNYMKLLSLLSIKKTEEILPQLILKKRLTIEAKKLMSHIGLKTRDRVVGISPGAHFGSTKRWPWRLYKKLIGKICSETAWQVVLIGSKKDLSVLGSKKLPKNKCVKNLVGKTTLEEAIKIISQCHVFIANDSGNAHLAAALDIPTITLFGSTSPVWTRPMGKQSKILRVPLACSPCFQKVCPFGHTQCLKKIRVNDVFSACRAYLKNMGR